jgi:hypothetical protein
MRQTLVGEAAHPLLPVRIEVAILAGFTVVFLFGARWALAFLENLSKREGRLTQRWQ